MVSLDCACKQLYTYAHMQRGTDVLVKPCPVRALMPCVLQENNFKAVLESIRDLMTEHHAAMPDWLLDIFLGYGNPAAASYQNLPNALSTIDFKDTFLDEGHLRASFPGERWRAWNLTTGAWWVPAGCPAGVVTCV